MALGFVALSFSTLSFASDNRVTLTVGSVTASTRDDLVTIPVMLSNPVDSIAGVEFQLKMEPNYYAVFPWDEVQGEKNLAGDTAGTLMSGWEWFNVSSLDKTEFDLKVAGMADWPNEKRHRPLGPQGGGVAAFIRVRLNRSTSIPDGTVIPIRLVPEKTGFSDPTGNSIGITTEIVRKCREFRGDSCLAWKAVRVARLDTVAVRLIDGGITLSDTLAPSLK